MEKQKDTRISFRCPRILRETVQEFVSLNVHMNESDFYREASREKIRRDSPKLYKKLFEKEQPDE